jgi:hypothetical protein
VPAHSRQAAEDGLLAGIGATLDELHHGDLQAMAQRASGNAEGGRGLALAVAGIHQQHAALGGGGLDLLVDDFLLALHAGLVARVACGFAHGFILGQGSAARRRQFAQGVAVKLRQQLGLHDLGDRADDMATVAEQQQCAVGGGAARG